MLNHALHSVETKQILRFLHRPNLVAIFDGLIFDEAIYRIKKLRETSPFLTPFIEQPLSTAVVSIRSQEDLKEFLTGRNKDLSSFVKVKLLYISVDTSMSLEDAETLRGFLSLRLNHRVTTVINFTKKCPVFEQQFRELMAELNKGWASVISVHYQKGQFISAGNVHPDVTAEDIVTHPVDAVLMSEDHRDPESFQHVGYLDIDGVLQHRRTFMRTKGGGTLATAFLKDPWNGIKHYDQELLAFLSKLSYKVGIKWYLSSTQRYLIKGEDLKAWARFVDLPIVGRTGNPEDDRGLEISEHYKANPVDGKAVILDDEPISDNLFGEEVLRVKVSPNDGLLYAQMQDICKHFGCSTHDLIGSSLPSRDWE